MWNTAVVPVPAWDSFHHPIVGADLSARSSGTALLLWNKSQGIVPVMHKSRFHVRLQENQGFVARYRANVRVKVQLCTDTSYMNDVSVHVVVH